MNKLFTTTLIATLGILTLNSSCKKKDADPMGYYTCTCFGTHRIDSVTVVLDTAIIHEDLMEKSLATTYCAGSQVARTDTFGNSAVCTLK